MTQAFPKTFVFDIGRSWTKAFLVENDKNKLVIAKKTSLPTSNGDISFTVNKLFQDLKITKGSSVIITGPLPEAETLAKNLDVLYISEEDAKEEVKKYLTKENFKDAVILDTSDYSYTASIKINQIGAFLTSELTEVDIENYFGNKSVRPHGIQDHPYELEIEEAFYRVAFSRNSNFIAAKNVVNVVITGSFFSLSPKQSKLALVIIDVLAKGRIAQVKLDREIFLVGFGALLKKFPQVATWENSFLQDLGSFISFGGKGRVLIDYGFTENQEISIVEDEIALVPASSKQELKITFLDPKEKDQIVLKGGAFGVLLDGRTKPLKIAFGRIKSRQNVKKWQEAIEKMEMIE
jgi:hypothetical protein